ncbi:AraC family transcriptional regulator [Flagellimonas marinaquae]|uniref:AraC family transcriptional regulator n=1 Tax=Flagellimonas marinaquae TaxID=254955 RepID=UPI000F8CA876|nr:helix-turn-helix domain-containing protein [Allomuricauda aquimarina]
MILGITLVSIAIALVIFYYNFHKNRNTLFLSGFIILLSIYSLAHYFTGVAFSSVPATILYNHFTPLFLLLGPFIFFYTRGLFCDKTQLHFRDWLHFLPAIVQLGLISDYFLIPFEAKKETLVFLRSNLDQIDQFDFNLWFSHGMNNVIRISSLLIYICVDLYLIFFVSAGKKRFSYIRLHSIRQWLMVFHILVMTIVVAYAIFMWRFQQDPYFLDSDASDLILVFAALGIFGLNIAFFLFPEAIYGVLRISPEYYSLNGESELKPEPLPGDIKKTVSTENLYLSGLKSRIEKYMSDGEPYLSKDFNLSVMARDMNVPHHHITLCFKDVFQTTFTAYKTVLRVQKAKEMLCSESTDVITIEAVGEECGFASRSAFYAAFKKVKGVNPGVYKASFR